MNRMGERPTQDVAERTVARIVLAGPVDKFQGVTCQELPRKSCTHLRYKQPIYILGGFGGRARDVAEALGLAESNSLREWPGREKFGPFKGKGLKERFVGGGKLFFRCLPGTPHIDHAIELILRWGLRESKLGAQKGDDARH